MGGTSINMKYTLGELLYNKTIPPMEYNTLSLLN